VIELRCSPETVLERIHLNTGGDRADRRDDDESLCGRNSKLFSERTAPLVAHYRAKGARVSAIDIDAMTTPEDVWRQYPRNSAPLLERPSPMRPVCCPLSSS
jgi:adenylate kinase family enzyme